MGGRGARSDHRVMETITTTPKTNPADLADSGRRTGAAWVAATGSALILAAAAVFVAVSWREIGDTTKFAILLGVTASAIAAGIRLRPDLPATGTVLVHLGTYLVPVNIAAANLRAGLPWQELLLVESIVCLGVFAAMARVVRSGVLVASATGAGLAVAAALGALTFVPAPFAAAVGAGLLVAVRRQERAAIGAVAAAAVAPITILAFDLVTVRGEQLVGRDVARKLGLIEVSPVWSGLTAALIALVVGVIARRFDRVALVTVAGVGAVAHGMAAWNAGDTSGPARLTALAAVFTIIEIAALAIRNDPFWDRLGSRLAAGAEFVSILAVMIAAFAVAAALRVDDLLFSSYLGDELAAPGPIPVGFVALVAVGFAVARIRRQVIADRGVPLPIFEVAAVLAAIGSLVVAAEESGMSRAEATFPIAIGSLALAAIWMALRTPASVGAGIVCAYAVAVSFDRPGLALTCGVVGAIACAIFAIVPSERSEQANRLLASSSVATLALAAVAASSMLGGANALALFIASGLALTIVIDRADPVSAMIARCAIALTTVGIVPLPPDQVWLPACALIGASAIEAWRTHERRYALAGVIPAVQLQVAAAALAGLLIAPSGLALCTAAFVWFGVAVLLDARWREPIVAAGTLTFVAGFVMALSSLDTAGPAIIGLGALGLGAGVLRASRGEPAEAVLHASGIIVTIGLWLVFGAHGLAISEAFLAPVSAHLLVVGVAARRRHGEPVVSSWLAFGPPIVMIVAPALLERFGGASANHALLAGAVGAVAVALGGWLRLIGPLLLGTLTLAIVTVHESLAAGVDVPTWAWLAAGGTGLLAAAVAMERSETSAVEVGRRVVDVLADRFE